MRRNITFYSEGFQVKGHLYLPDKGREGEQFPAILLCHGFAGVKELLLPAYAERFCEKGFAALTFDYRGFGESEGERGRLIPREQVVDIRNAITYLQSLEEVDSQNIALWGTSFGGANAIVAASMDRRVKCLTVQSTFGNGERVITGNLGEEEKKRLFDTILKVWTRAVTKNKVMQVTVEKVLTDEQSIEFYHRYVEQFPQLKTPIPFLTIKETIEYKPEDYVASINVPIFITGVENDKVNPVGESYALYERAKEPKELYIVENATHYEVYEGERFEETVARQVEWFERWFLRNGDTPT